MVDEGKIVQAVELLRQAAPGAKIILFGSYARGDATENSDLDLLVIEPQVKSRLQEMVRLRRALGSLGVPVDLLVASQELFTGPKRRDRSTMTRR